MSTARSEWLVWKRGEKTGNGFLLVRGHTQCWYFLFQQYIKWLVCSVELCSEFNYDRIIKKVIGDRVSLISCCATWSEFSFSNENGDITIIALLATILCTPAYCVFKQYLSRQMCWFIKMQTWIQDTEIVISCLLIRVHVAVPRGLMLIHII